MGLLKNVSKVRKNIIASHKFRLYTGIDDKKIIENKNYKLTFHFQKENLVVRYLKNTSDVPNYRDLKEVYLKLLNLAKKNNSKKIILSTWIFFEKEKLAKELGFKMVLGTDKKIKQIKKNYPDYEIKGIDTSFNLSLVLKNKKNKSTVLVDIDKETLPVYIKEL